MVLRFVVERDVGHEIELRNLLIAALCQCETLDLEEVVIWAPPEQTWTAALMLADDMKTGHAVVIHREEIQDAAPLVRWRFGRDRIGEWEQRQYYGFS